MNYRSSFTGCLLAALLCVAVSDPAFAQHEGHDMPGMAHSKQSMDSHAPQQDHQQMMHAMMRDVAELRGLRGEARERMFLTKMMDHHQSGIDMAKLAVQKSRNPAIVAEAKKIIADQTREIGQMRQHLASAHRINRTAKPDPRMQPMMQMLKGLSGESFDKAFVHYMTMHHQGAIDMAEVVVTKGVPHAPVKNLAAKTIKGNKRSQTALHHAVA